MHQTSAAAEVVSCLVLSMLLYAAIRLVSTVLDLAVALVRRAAARREARRRWASSVRGDRRGP